ncbi:putative harbinger transposase-derived nuclease [Abeliophyllum distichum]|uniref:Harbinger transposase-derived nuclease n=1 Tax=Abeliophyllum distichum TaxID=126358 RepID=A0ABD1RVR1_9LAMI
MVIQAIVIYDGIRRRARHIPRAPHRNWDIERQMTLTRMFGTSNRICRDLLRMKIGQFQSLCARLRTFGLVDSKSVRVEEQVAIFLNTIGHDQRLYREVVTNATIHNSSYEKDNVKPWYSYFQDAVGVIDGTHIAANVPVEDQARYRNMKQVISQNVLVACTFDMKFTYVLAGWEGSAHDGRLLRSDVPRQGHKLTIPVDDVCEEDFDTKNDGVNPTNAMCRMKRR